MPELKSSRYAVFDKLRTAMASQGRALQARPWIAPTAWAAGIAIKAGEVRKNAAGQWYVALNSSTTGSTEPTQTDGSQFTDGAGAVIWSHIGGPVGDPANDVEAPTVTDTGLTSVPGGMNAIDVWANRSLFRLRGAYGVVYAANRLGLNVFNKNATPVLSKGGCSVAFWHDGSSIAFEGFGGTPGIGINVDGRPLRMGTQMAQLAGNYWTSVTWSTRKPRLYEITFDKANSTFMRIGIPASDMIWPEAPALPLRGVFLGDSYPDGSGYGPFLPGNTLSEDVGRLIGITDMWRFAIGGTGLLNTGIGTGSPFYTYIQRVPELLTLNPDVIWIYGSTNDISPFTQQQVTDAALALIDAIRTGGSTAPIFWVGPAPISSNYAAVGVVDAGIATAVAARPTSQVFYKSMYTATPPWLTGAHNNASYTWSSNISQYIGGDNVHPLDRGHRYLAQRMAQWFGEITQQVA